MKHPLNKYLLSALLFLFSEISIVKSQSIIPIKVRKDKNIFIFLQKGISNDSINKNFGNDFYLIVNDSLKKYIVIHIENGQLISTSNDSVVKLNYMKKLRYECFYTDVSQKNIDKTNNKNIRKFETLINGVSTFPENKIRIQIFDGRTRTVLLENVYYYRE